MTSAQHEQAVVIQDDLPTPMLGVLHIPDERCSGTGVVIVNGGAQYRAGAHRLFVHLARHLATSGHAVLRFDLPGQGDSPGEPTSFENTAAHLEAAIDCLHQKVPQLGQTALLGLCDGASASLLYLDSKSDPRITHLLLFNPWVHSPQSEAQAQVRHYYRQRLLMPEFWKRLLSGKIGAATIIELLKKLLLSRQTRAPGEPSAFQDRMARAWRSFCGSTLVVLSPQDKTAQEFIEVSQHAAAWQGWNQDPRVRVMRLPDADHTFSPPDSVTTLLRITDKFLGSGEGTEAM